MVRSTLVVFGTCDKESLISLSHGVVEEGVKHKRKKGEKKGGGRG